MLFFRSILTSRWNPTFIKRNIAALTLKNELNVIENDWVTSLRTTSDIKRISNAYSNFFLRRNVVDNVFKNMLQELDQSEPDATKTFKLYAPTMIKVFLVNEQDEHKQHIREIVSWGKSIKDWRDNGILHFLASKPNYNNRKLTSDVFDMMDDTKQLLLYEKNKSPSLEIQALSR